MDTNNHRPQIESEVRTAWTSSPPVPVDPPSAVRAVKYALKRYIELGIPLPAGNRLQLAGKLLGQYIGPETRLDRTDKTTHILISHAIQTAVEHLLIAKATRAASGRLEPTHIDKIRESLSGDLLATKTEKNSLGRDTQFELYVRALFAMADIPIQIAEPDLVFRYENQIVGLAAKRVKKIKQLRTRFKDAADQIKRSGLKGFVALGADPLIMDLELKGNTANRGVRFSEHLGLERIDAEFSQCPHVLGRFTYATAFVWDLSSQPPALEVATFRQFRAYASDEEDIAIADRFQENFNQRLEERMLRL